MTLTEAGEVSMTLRQLLEATRQCGAAFAEETLREAVQADASDMDGSLARLRQGVYALRQDHEPAEAPRTARDWVLEALAAQQEEVQLPVTGREVQERLAASGVRYSRRAVSQALTTIVRDPSAGVTVPMHGHYRLDAS